MKALSQSAIQSRVDPWKTWPLLGLVILTTALPINAQVSVNGSWSSSGGGTWGGNLTQWATTSPLRAADLSVTRKAVATATAVRNSRGEIIAVNLVNGGSGYTVAPTVIISGGTTGGYGARAVATISGGSITGIKVIAKGGGYTATPTVTITSELAQVTVSNGGSGYTGNPQLFFQGGGGYTVPPNVTFTTGTGATATAVRTGDKITAINPGNVGIGYGKNGTQVTITGGGGTGATATPVITGDINVDVTADIATDLFTVVGAAPANDVPVEFSGSDVPPGGISLTQRYFVINSSGSTFQVATSIGGAPVDLITTPGSAVVFTSTTGVGRVVGYVMTNEGSGYTSTPAVTVTATPPTSAASAVAVTEDGVVTGIEILSPGAGYLDPPQVRFSAGGGEVGIISHAGTEAVAEIQDGQVTEVTLTAPGGAGGVVSTVNLTAEGAVSSIVLNQTGYGFTSLPTLDFGRTLLRTAQASASRLGNALSEIVVTNPGAGYVSVPSVSIGTGGWRGYAAAPRVSFVSNGIKGAIASATRSGNTISAVAIVDGGDGYVVPPTVEFRGGGGSGAAATAVLTGSRVTSITMTAFGSGYTSTPNVTFTSNGVTYPIATSNISAGRVSSFNIIYGGASHTVAPTVSMTAAPNGGIAATAAATLTGGAVTSIALTPGGEGYAVAPRVSFISNGITGAIANATLTGNAVSAVSVLDSGDGYTTSPIVAFQGGGGSGAAATANLTGGKVTSVTVTSAGSGYTSPPTVTFTSNGSGATASAALVGFVVSTVTVLQGGTGYDVPPAVIFQGGGGSGAVARANLTGNQVTSITVTSGGFGYTSAPTVTLSRITWPVVSSSFTSGKVTGFTVLHGGAGLISAPTVAIAYPPANSTAATAAARVDGGAVTLLALTTGGGAIPATATAVLSETGTIASINITQLGSGYTANPSVTLAAPTGFLGSAYPAPGGIGSYVYFNNNTAGANISLEAPRTVGMLTIGDSFEDQDFTLSAGSGGVANALTFAMGGIGGGKSFINKAQGDQDVISARVRTDEELNIRVNSGRLTLSGGLSGSGDFVSTGNGILTIRGNALSSSSDLWLQNRGGTGTGAQVELGVTGGSAFQNVRIGSASLGSAGHAVLQLLENRFAIPSLPALDQGNQIGDMATVIADGASNRWAYFKLMGGNETIGNIMDIGSSLVLENMEGETVNRSAVLTLGGNNLDSFIGGFVRNRAGGSGTGKLGLTKNGTGSLTLRGGNISYTGSTLLNGGTLNLINTTSFVSSINAAAGTTINVDTQGSTINFDDSVLGAANLSKFGSGNLSFNSGAANLDSLSSYEGTVSFRSGEGSLRGEKALIEQSLTLRGTPGLNKSLSIGSSLSAGNISLDGGRRDVFAISTIAGQIYNANSIGSAFDAVVEATDHFDFSSVSLRLNSAGSTIDREVQNAASGDSLTLKDVSNLVVGSILTLSSNTENNPFTGVVIPANTRILAINQTSRTLTLNQSVIIPAGRKVSINYSSATDGAIRGESLNFADVVHDGRQFIAVTSKGTIHTSTDGQLWDRRYKDPAAVPFSSITWTGERLMVVGNLGRVLTSTDGGINWSLQDSGSARGLNGTTSANLTFTGNVTVDSAVIQNVPNASSYAIGTPIFGFVSAPGTQIASATGTSVVIDSNPLAVGTDVDFGYFRGTTSSGANQTTITNVRTAQNLATGTVITSGNLIPAETTISAVNGPNSTLTLSQPAVLSGTSVRLFTLTGNIVLNSTVIQNVSNTNGLAVGMIIAGQGIPAGAYITAMTSNTISLSEGAIATTTAVPLSVFRGTLTANSALVQDVSSVSSFRPQMAVRGLLFPSGTRVTASTANTLTVSNTARATATGASLTQTRTERIASGSFTINSSLVTGVTDAATLSVGMPVFLAGVTQPGTVINAISGTDVTLSQNALQNASSATFRAGFNMIVVGTSGYIATSLGGETGSWLVRTSGVSITLNSISASPTTFVAVGTAGRLLDSPDGVTWTNQTPPLNSSGQFITDVTGSNVTMSGNAAAGTAVSFGAFKGNTSDNNEITNLSSIHSVRVGIPVFAESGIPAGTRVRSVEATGFTMTTASTITEASKPIRTFTAVVTAGSSLLTEVSDFKGLAVGMALHGSAFNGTETGIIFGLFPDSRVIWLTRVPPTEGRGSFGVMYGDLSVNSPIVRNVSNLPSIQRRPGTTHFSQGKSVASVAGKIPSEVTISSYNASLNELKLSSKALSNASDVPLLTFKGMVTNNSSVITGVVDFSELTEGMLLLVTGDAQGTANAVPFYVSLLDDANDTVYLSAAPNLNVGSAPVEVSLGIYTGTISSGSDVVTKIKNLTPIPVTLPKLDDVFWTGSQFIAVGDYGSILTSQDGRAWTSQNSGTGLDLSAVATAGSQILVAGQDGLILSSSNGTTWAVSRAADSAAINDLRTVDRIKTVISANGRTVALGNGGLSTATGGTWSTSLNSTFSGTQLDIGLGGIMTIRNEVTFNTRAGAGIIERNQNNTNRIDDAAILNSKGGRFEFSNNGVDNVAYSESIGKLLLSEGQLTIRTTTAGVGGSSLLQFGSLEQKPGATLNFSSRRKDETGDDPALLGANALNRIVFTKNPTLKGGIIGGWATAEGDWATYDATNGVVRLKVNDYENVTGFSTSWSSTKNVRTSGFTAAAAAAYSVNSLNLTGGTLNLADFRLSVESGGILANSGSPTITGAGMLTVGTALNAPQTLYLINNSSLTINNPIRDFESRVPLTSSQSTGTLVITLPTAAAKTGLLRGMEVSVFVSNGSPDGVPPDTYISPGTRIEEVNSGNSITLTSPTKAVIPNGATLIIRGGSVSLSKSGSGLLTLNGTNDYTGKTYINSGTLLVRDSALASLGAAPSAYVQDQIQINGGTLQIGHRAPENRPAVSMGLTDRRRGLKIGTTGGRIEVGSSNPDNDNGVPVINFSITNPIYAEGLLEVAIRSSSEQQFNSLTLGNASSSNTYLTGIQTDVTVAPANYNGLLTILGNNTIGGINQQGGDIVITGNNNFTGGIRSTQGNITIEGSNTWQGGTRFDQPISMASGILKLKTPNALGTGGLNLNLGASILQLAGISQTIRQITDTAGSTISNTEAPTGLTAPTELIFDISNNQTVNSLIGNDVFADFGLRLIKQGPGDLALTNTSSNFSDGLEIRNGSVSVTSISDNNVSESVLGYARSDDPRFLLIDKSALIFNLTSKQRTNRSFTMGTGANAATLIANGTNQEARIIFGREDRDQFTSINDLSQPIAFKDGGDRTLTLGGTGRGDNTLLLELRDKSISEITGLMKLGSGTWVLGKAAPYSGLTSINEGILAVTSNNALGTDAEETTVNPALGTFTGNLANGTEINFPFFLDTTLPIEVQKDKAYYVVASNGTTFKIAATFGGAPLSISSAGVNVRFVPKIDSFRSTSLNIIADTFTGNLTNGDIITFNQQIVAGVTPALPAELLTNTYYYVINSSNGAFQVSLTPEPNAIPVNFSTEGTKGSLYYATQKVGNPSGGVNLTSGTLLLSNVDYITPETLNLEGGTVAVPVDSKSIWAGNIQVNSVSTINVGQGGSLTLAGNLTGTNRIVQEGEGRLILQGETLMPISNGQNSVREFAVRAGTLVLDYSANNASKLVDNADLRLGGSRRGGEVVLSGGDHEEIVVRTILESGVSKIFREGGTSSIRLNGVLRNTGSSLYVDTGRLVKTDQPNINGLMGAWAIVRDAVTNAFWVIPGNTSYTFTATADPSTDRLTTTNGNGERLPHTLANGTLVRFSSTGTLPGGLSSSVSYYVSDTSGSSENLNVPSRIGTLQVALLPGNSVTPVNITSPGTGTLTMTSQISFTVNSRSDTFTTSGDHRLAKGGMVRLASYGTLPGGLSSTTDYYLIDVALRTFRLSLSPDGRPVNITDTGTGIHTVESQGTPKRAGSSALIFTANPVKFPASQGNGKIKVAISPQPILGDITASITGDGTLASPYIYTIFTTEEKNSNKDIVAFVNNDTQRSEIFSVALSGGNDYVNSVKDPGAYGSPTFLANGSFDSGNTELDWARNEAIEGSFNDGFVMPNGEYVSTWSPLSNTAVTQNLTIGSGGRDTFSLRFATQNTSTVNLANSALNTIRSGGILISPTVGANDSAINGTGSISTGGEGNLQNLLVHQYNELGSLNIGAKVTDRLAVQRLGRLTGAIRNTIILNDVAGVSVGQVITGTGITTGPEITNVTRVSAIDAATRTITLSRDHNGAVLSSAVNYSFGYRISGVASSSNNFELTLNNVDGLAVGNAVSGTGIINGTLITAINPGTKVVSISIEHDGINRSGPNHYYTFVNAVQVSGVASSTDNFELALNNVDGLAVGNTVSGTGISNGTLITAINPGTKVVRINIRHDDIPRPNPVTYSFTGIPGVASDPNRRFLAGVVNAKNLTPGMTVTGPGLLAGTTVVAVDKLNLIVTLSWDHDGNYRRGDYVFDGNITSKASTGDSYRRRIIGLVKPGNSLDNASQFGIVSTTDLYVGMPIAGPGIPFGATISFIFSDGDIEVSSNHFFTGESSLVRFTPSTGIEKLGGGTLVLSGDNQYTGITYIGEGVLRAQKLTDGGVIGSLGASSAASSNLFFNGGELQYVGESVRTNRGFQLAESAILNIGHEKTMATFTGTLVGSDRFEKQGPGTLVFNGNAGLESFRVEQGRLLLQAIDTNPSPGTFSPTNFSQTNLTSLRVAGGTLELRGTPEGNVAQTFGSTFFIEEGASELKVTSVASFDPNNLIATTNFRSTTLTLMGQEENAAPVRSPGASLLFTLNAETTSAPAKIFLASQSRGIQPWATFRDLGSNSFGGVNDFAFISSTGEITSANNFLKTITDTSEWAIRSGSREAGDNVSEVASQAFTGTIAQNRFVNTIRYESTVDSTINIESGKTLELLSGAILVAFDVNGAQKRIMGPGKITGGLFNSKNSDFIIHNYNPASTFTIGAGIIDRSRLAQGSAVGVGSLSEGQSVLNGVRNLNLNLLEAGIRISGPGIADGTVITRVDRVNRIVELSLPAESSQSNQNFTFTVGRGSLLEGQSVLKVLGGFGNFDSTTFLLSLQVGIRVEGPGIADGTVVTRVDVDNQIVGLSLPAKSNQIGQTYTFTETVNLIQTGLGTTILSGTNQYTGKTFVHGGVLRLDSQNAIPGGIASTGGTSPIVVEGGILGLGAENFSRNLGVGNDRIEFKGNGGFAAYGADRTVSFGGTSTPERLRFGNQGFVPDGSSLLLGSQDATHKLTFQNPLDLGAFSQAINVGNGLADVDAELAGDLSGLGRLIKFGLGTLRLGVSNTNSGGIEIAEGRVIAANVTNVFGLSGSTTGVVRLGSSKTNSNSGAGIDLQMEGGTIDNKLEVGALNSSPTAWVAGGQVDSSQTSTNVGVESNMILVDGTPAIAYYDSTNKDLKYVRAQDARGTSWNTPITIASRGDVGKSPSLAVINGNPAITYYDETSKTLMYVRSNDVPGVVWGNPAPILAPNVLAVAAQADGKILVAGSFTRFDGDNNKRRIVRLQKDVATDNWIIDPTFNALVVQNGEVRDILPQANGKIIIGGTFTTLRNAANSNDVSRSRLARLNENGTLDESFSQNLNGDVRVLFELPDQKFLVGGAFSNIGGVNRSRMARLNADGSLDNSFNSPDIRNGEVRAITVQNVVLPNQPVRDAYVVGGNFTSVRGNDNRNRLARIELDGGFDATFNPDANGDVNAIVTLPDNKLLVGGSFGAFAGTVQSRTRLARLNVNGSLDNGFAQEVNGTVNRLVLERTGSVLVSGTFSILGDFQRSFLGRVLSNGNIDPIFNPDPNFEVRDLIIQQGTLPADDKILLGGIFTNLGGLHQRAVARIDADGDKDPLFTHAPLDTGKYNSLLSVNGNPAVCYYEATNQDIEYVRSTDVNGASWPNPQLIDSTGDVGVGISMMIANIGGDVLIKDTLGTPTEASDDEVTISANAAGVENRATIGTPVIAYGDATDATNAKLKYVVANNSTGDVNSFPVTNWSVPNWIPLAAADRVNLPHFSMNLVDGFPAIAYQTVVGAGFNLKFIRANDVAGLKNNLRDQIDSSIKKIKVSDLVFPISSSWGTAQMLDGSGKAGGSPSLALVNGQPTSVKDRPAVSFYDANTNDLKIIVATSSDGGQWPLTATLLASVGDVGKSSTLIMTDGLPAVSYYNETDGDLAFLIRNEASGYSRVSFAGNTTWSGNVDLQGTAILAPAAGQTATISGILSGPSGFKLVGEGILNLTNAANLFGTSLGGPKLVAESGAPVNGAVVIRSGTLQFAGTTGENGTTALGTSTVELGDAAPKVMTADWATNGKSMLLGGGTFSTNHNGSDFTVGGPGVFVKVGPTIDGKFFGLVATTANSKDDFFTGNLTNGTKIRFDGERSALPAGIQAQKDYFVRKISSTTFEVSETLGGPKIDITSSGGRFYYFEEAILNTVILVKDEADHPERNGLYKFVIDGDFTSLSESEINLIRILTFDEPSEMLYGTKVGVLAGTSAGKTFYLSGDVRDLNLSSINWIDETAVNRRALLASVAGLTVGNAIDVNANGGTSIIGAVNTVTTGQTTFTGAMTLQNLSADRENQTVSLSSFIASGLGLVYQGVISEANGGMLATSDKLSLVKEGSGIATLTANNTFGGGITINQGTLLIMNTPGPNVSGSGTGAITVNPGTVLGGIGSITGAVNLTGTSGNLAVLRPGDPISSTAPVETLTIQGPITVGPDSVIEFTIGVSNMTKLAGTSINLSTASSRIVVQAELGFVPTVGTEFDLLDLTGGLTVFGELTNLLNLLQLPAETVWNTSQFLTTGKIIADGVSVPVEITTHPLSQTVVQGTNVTLNMQFTGTGPNTFQWYKGDSPVLGATNPTLTLTGVTQADEGNYTVRVFSPLNPAPVGVVSNPATLTVDWPLSFAVNLPSVRQGSLNYPLTFKVVMNGEGPFRYQWKKGSVEVGSNSDTYTIDRPTAADNGGYSVVVKGPSLLTQTNDSVTSTICSLTVVAGPGVTAPVSPPAVAEGADIELAADISGDPATQTIQWFRDGVAVLGANSPTLSLCGVTIANSGDYTVQVTGPGLNGKPITVTSSPPASVVIVDNAAKIVPGQIGKTVTLVANAGSTKTLKSTLKPATQTFQWFKNGGPLPSNGRFTGGNTKSLKIINLDFEDTAVYTCKVSGAPGTANATAGTTYLRVYDQAPVVDASPRAPKGMVGGFYSWKIPVTSDVPVPISGPNPELWKRTPATYAVTGLPPGLKLNASTGVISGYPTAATTAANPSGYPIKITVTNAIRPATGVTTNTTTAFIDIRPLPVGIVGNYTGPISRHASNGNLGGRFNMTVSSTGAYTGSVTIGSLAARSFKGGFDINLNRDGDLQGLIGAKVILPGVKGGAAMDLEFELQTTAAVTPAVAPTTLIVNATAKVCGASTGAVITGWRSKWAAKAVVGVSDVPTAYVGTLAIAGKPAIPASGSTPGVPAVPAVPATTGPYNFLIALPDADPLISNALVPQGTGYASFTVSTTGTCTIAGRTADGMPITGAYSVGPTGQLFFFQTLYTTTTRGSLLGNLQIELGATPLDNDVSGNFSWVRPPDPATVSATRSRLYRSGFGTTQTVAGVPATTVTTPVQLVAFGGRYVAPPTTGTAPLKVLMGLDPFDPTNPSAQPNAELIFSERGDGATRVVSERDPNIAVKIEKGSKTTTPTFKEPTLAAPVDNPNPAATTVRPTASTGAFTGTFTLIDPSTTAVPLRRSVTFQGLIVRERISNRGDLTRKTRTYGQGYFIINQLPQVSQSATLTPQLSGVVEFRERLPIP